MLLLSALWLAVVQALTSAVPASLGVPIAGLSRVASVGVAGTRAASTSAPAHPASAAATTRRAPRLGDEEFRPPASQRLSAVERASNRSLPPLRPPAGLAALAPAGLSLPLLNVRSRAGHQLSHAAASRGGHLPYYPTAPPLQG
ncbi:MAG TPA: hypothetical protein VKA54_07230 [Gemmatimonadaceae bacterium]|nr:hypothetical protein [Gemmatimonadaceae bacterium]